MLLLCHPLRVWHVLEVSIATVLLFHPIFCQTINLDSLGNINESNRIQAIPSELPKSYLISITTNGRKLEKGPPVGNAMPLYLQHHENTLTFELPVSAFGEPLPVRYRYLLKGFDEDWAETTQPSIRYTHLPPGRYCFRLLAYSSDVNHAEQPLEWHFRILPPWWATRWAYLAYSFIVAAIAYAFFSQSIKQERMSIEMLPLRKSVRVPFAKATELNRKEIRKSIEDDEIMKNLMGILEKNYGDEEFDTSKLCHEMGMSRAQCYRKITTVTCEPLALLLRKYRLQKAKDLLATSSLSISQIALEVGFKDLAHFSHCFHQYFGINPKEFRKRDGATKI